MEINICKKRIYVHIHINTHDWEISGVIHKKLIAVVASVKSGRWVVRGGVFRFHLKSF